MVTFEILFAKDDNGDECCDDNDNVDDDDFFACLCQPTIITFALEWLNGLFECYGYKYYTRLMRGKII